MGEFKVAYFKEQGVTLVVIPLDSSFEHKSKEDQSRTVSSLQVCATSAGLAGTVVPVWEYNGSFRFIAPKNWHPFFQTPGIYQRILSNINKELTCG